MKLSSSLRSSHAWTNKKEKAKKEAKLLTSKAPFQKDSHNLSGRRRLNDGWHRHGRLFHVSKILLAEKVPS